MKAQHRGLRKSIEANIHPIKNRTFFLWGLSAPHCDSRNEAEAALPPMGPRPDRQTNQTLSKIPCWTLSPVDRPVAKEGSCEGQLSKNGWSVSHVTCGVIDINHNSRKRNACIYLTSTTDFDKFWPQFLPTPFLKTPAFCMWNHYTRSTRKSRKWVILWLFFPKGWRGRVRSASASGGEKTIDFPLHGTPKSSEKLKSDFSAWFFFNPLSSSTAMFDKKTVLCNYLEGTCKKYAFPRITHVEIWQRATFRNALRDFTHWNSDFLYTKPRIK